MNFKRVIPILFLIILGLIGRIYISVLPIEKLVGICLCDDAFYYFKIAQNVVDGHGSSFDGQSKTNGFHPLWMIVCLILIKINPDPDFFVHLILIISSLLDTATGLIIYITVQKFLKNSFVSLLSSSVYLFNPINLLVSNFGMETSLNLFILSLTFYKMCSIIVERNFRNIVSLSVLLALLILSRTDNFFYFIGILIYLAYLKETRKPAYHLTIITIISLILSPWLIWNIYHFGTVSQDSAFAITIARFKAVSSVTSYLLEALKNIVAIFSFWIPTYSGTLYLNFLLIGMLIVLLQVVKKENKAIITAFIIFLIIFCLLLIFHAIVRMSIRPWYVAPLQFYTSILTGIVTALFLHYTRYNKILFLLLSFIILFSIIVPNLRYVKIGYYPENYEKIKMSQIINNIVPEGEKVGCFNAGIIGYYSKRQVINLDGLVNHEVQKFLKGGDIIQII